MTNDARRGGRRRSVGGRIDLKTNFNEKCLYCDFSIRLGVPPKRDLFDIAN